MNASIIHAIRILLDHTSLYMRMSYPNEQISDKRVQLKEWIIV